MADVAPREPGYVGVGGARPFVCLGPCMERSVRAFFDFWVHILFVIFVMFVCIGPHMER